MKKRLLCLLNIFIVVIAVLVAGCGGREEKPKELALCSSMSKNRTELFANAYSKASGTKVRISYLPGGTLQERQDFLRKQDRKSVV